MRLKQIVPSLVWISFWVNRGIFLQMDQDMCYNGWIDTFCLTCRGITTPVSISLTHAFRITIQDVTHITRVTHFGWEGVEWCYLILAIEDGFQSVTAQCYNKANDYTHFRMEIKPFNGFSHCLLLEHIPVQVCYYVLCYSEFLLLWN